MILTYTVRDAEQWAAFSGDYNPIHFDLERARALGGDDLSVHGMRALLDMKQYLSAALLQASPQAEFYMFSARLRQPLMCHKSYQMSLTGQPDGTKVRGTLVDEQSDSVCFSAKLTAAAPLTIAPADNVLVYSSDDLRTLSHRFPLPAQEPARLWSFLDAVLFQRIVEAPDTMRMVKEVFPQLRANALIDVFGRVPVVQTHHDVHFNACLFSPDADFHAGSGMHCAIQPTLVTGSGESGFVLSIVIQAWSDEQPLLSTAVTLKTLPDQVNSYQQ